MPPADTMQELSPGAAKFADVPPGKRKVKETPAEKEVKDKAYRCVAKELRGFVESYEQLDAEKAEVSDRQKEVMAKAKATGYDTKAIRKIIRLRKLSKDEREDQDAVLQLYRDSLKV